MSTIRSDASDPIRAIETKRETILSELREIRSLRRGTLNEQFLKVQHRGKKEPVLRGPYFVLSRRQGARTVSERIPADQVEQTRRDIAADKRLAELCKQYEDLTEQLGATVRDTRREGLEKKRSKLPLKKTPKSRD
jgi:hypothetical protein